MNAIETEFSHFQNLPQPEHSEFSGERSALECRISDISFSVTFGIKIILQGPGVGRKSCTPSEADKAPFLKALLERK